jgi:Fe-S oxidoreductase
MVDRRLLSIAREKDASYHKVLPAEAESMLLVEFQTNDAAKLEHKLESLVRQVQRRSQLAFDVRTTTDPRERDFFWHLVRRIVPIQYRLGGQRRAIPFVEDIAIEPTLLPEFLQHLHGILNRHEVTASVFAHMPQGHLHVRPLINMADPTVLPKLQRLATELFDYVVSLGGTISGGLGDGLSRTWYLRQQYGPLYRVMAEVKDVFDPQNVLNPGKVINHPAHGVTDDVRSVTVAPSLFRTAQSADAASNKPSSNVGAASTPGKLNANSNVGSSVSGNGLDNGSPESQPLPIVPTELTWDLEQTAAAAQACNGCGRCRTLSPSERMCPVFRMSPREESSPRSKANLMRGIVTGQLDPKLLATKEFRTIADLCVNCHQCRLDCPASVDVPKLMVEAKAQHYLTNGVAISDWVLTRLDWLYGIAGRMPRITNRMIRNRFARWILDRLFGIAEGRKLPPFAASPFSRWASRQKLTGTKVAGDSKAAKVVYFVDAYANWNDVELAQAFVEVLRHNQVQVAIPPDQLVSGMSLISDGAITRARKIAQANVELLAEWVRDGYRVVTTEPSAALALSHEYLNLLDDEDARLVADNTIDGMNFLLELHRRDELSLDFQPVQATIGYHLPCHQRALAQTVPAVELLRLIPGLNVEVFDKGCSGMAGTFGLKRKNYLTSLRMGFGLIDAVRQDHLIAATTECSTCKIQMEQGTEKPTVHPIKIMAMAYGAMSDLDDILERRSGTLVTT